MRTVRVDASRSYDIHIGPGLLAEAGERIKPLCPGGACAIVTDDVVDGLYAGTVEKSLRDAGLRSVKFVFPNGESGKNAENYINLLNFLAENRLTRADCVIALGGGVPGDLAGFAAATYLRGIGFVQLPTTLLAAVDSSVGGKTGIDLAAGKNLAGAFYQPGLVLCDTDTLATLPDVQFRAGCAEVIKYAMLFDAELFNDLMVSGPAFHREAIIARCVGFKRDVVADDEFDNGCRQLLNFGHTVGHAVEKLSGYTVLHGQAVAIGMSVVTKMACNTVNGCSPDCARALDDILIRFGLPTACPYSAGELTKVISMDKKRRGGVITLVVPRDVGSCELVDVPVRDLQDCLKAVLS